MTDLCGQDVVVQITPITPQILTAAPGGAARGGAGGAGELGRRLLAAARGGDTALVLELMAAGAAFTADWLGTSPLHAAAAGAHADTCAVLLRAGVSRDCRTKVERTALHEAAAAGHARVAALLLANGAAPDAADMLRMTPLHWAAERGHAAVVRVLLRHGADPTLRSKFLLTPRELAARRRHADVLRLLDDALRDREAERRAAPAPHPAPEQTTTSPPEPSSRRVYRAPYPAQQSTEPIKIKVEKPEGAAGGAGGGAALLRAHGITLLPPDAGSTVLSALQSGRSVVLSDAGKLMLKESVPSVNKVLPPATSVGATPAASRASVVLPAPGAAAGGAGARGVLLTATPVRETPRGVKVFTLNNKSLALPKENVTPVKKVVNPQDMQIKLVQLGGGGAAGGGGGGEARLASPLKAKRGVKIIMHKANFDKMVAATGGGPAPATGGGPAPAPDAAPAAAGDDGAALAAAQRTIATLAAELRAARDELQQVRDELHHTRGELQHTQEQLRQYRPDVSLQ